MPSTPRALKRLLLTIVVLALWGLITHGTFAGSGDEPHYLAVAHSIAFDSDFDLSNNYGDAEPLIAGGALTPEAHVRPGVGGVMRPVHDVGLPMLFAPYVRVAVPLTNFLSRTIPPGVLQRAKLNPGLLYRHLLSLAMITLTAILAGLMFDTLIAVGAPARFAFATALIVTLSPPLLIFAILFFTELLSALLCFAVFRSIVITPTTGARAWAIVGLAAGTLFLVHARNIGFVLPLSAIALFQLRSPSRRGEAAAFTIALAVAIAVRTWINYHFWGTLVQGPHARFEMPGLDAVVGAMGMRITALLVDQEFGLFTYAPIYVLAIGGVFVFAREKPQVTLAAAIVCVSYVGLIACPITNVHGWMGGWNPAARFLTPLMPVVALFVYAGLRASPRLLAIPIVSLQILISAYAWQHPKVLWNDGDGVAAFCETTASRVCAWLPSFPGP